MTPLATKAGKAVSWFVPNDIESVREASREVRHALATEGVTQEEQNAWELVTMEAATNAIKYARPSQRNLPIEVRVTITEKDIEVQIEDFSSGFDWPDRYKLPDPSSESGRGLYLITALTDTAQYFRDNTSNRLVLRRERSGSVLLSKLLHDGRRQVVGIAVPGDFLGLPLQSANGFTATTLTPANLQRFDRIRFTDLLNRAPGLMRQVFENFSHELTLAQEHMLLLGRRSAEEKVAAFLLSLRDR